jgi:raffinose/stachyose/melibiose transport system substrate-binding protein
MKIKRMLALVLAAVMMFSLIGCSAKNGSGKKIKLTMWCIATEGDSNRGAYEKAIDELKKTMPNIELEWEAIENETYKTKIKSAMAANELPDIFFTWSGAFLGDFVAENKVYCLKDALSKYNDLPASMLGNVTYADGKPYGVPTTMNVVALFANMDLLGQVGYTEVPSTYDQFIDCCDKLVAKGITPIAVSGSETWCVTEWLEPMIEKTIGADALNDIFRNGATFDNAGVKSAVDALQSMIKKGYFAAEGASLKNDDVRDNFAMGKYAFYQNGTWNCANFADQEKFPGFIDKCRVTEFPVIDSTNAKLGQLIGGPSDTLAVSASSKHAKEAAEYCVALGREISHYGYLSGAGLPAWTPTYEANDINPLTKAVAEICNKANAYVLFGDTAMGGSDKDNYLEYVGKVYASEVDGAGFTSGLKKAVR